MGSRVVITLGLAGALAFGCQASPPDNVQPETGGSGGSGGNVAGGGGDGGGNGGAAGASSSSSSSSSSSGAGGSAPLACVTDADCANDPGGAVCDTATGNCVGCLPGAGACPQGQYCDPVAKQCAPGCLENVDCSGINQVCDVSSKTCVECVVDTDCQQGFVCGANTCFPGCSGQQPCAPGFSCCGTNCYDLAVDVNNCGVCNNACKGYPNAKATCADGNCAMGACNAAFADCDKDPANGCEWNLLQDGPCACTPGATKACYQGAPGTEAIGPCKAGQQTCNAAGTGWGPCTGQVLPKAEICANSIDEDCNGVVDDSIDFDGDGWTACGGDCCDSVLQPGCTNPKLINPGAFEVVGNGINDDCDATTSDVTPQPECSTVAKFSGVTAQDVANAMELCQTTTANPPLLQKKWGVISAQLLLANGTNPSATQLADMQGKQIAILTDYGTGGIVPKKGLTMAGISSGTMRDKNDAGYVGTSTSLLSNSQPPAAYLAANNGALPSSAGCSGACPAGSGANDSVNVRLSIRVPTNAQSFTYQFKFVSSEYWTWSCSSFNDFYLALLQSGAQGLPADKNISFDGANNPVSVNNGFFDICVPKGCYTCPAGAAELVGTGMEDGSTGGATKWLFTDSPVVPGETIQLEFMIFDVSDTALDSLTLLDNFSWKLETATLETHE